MRKPRLDKKNNSYRRNELSNFHILKIKKIASKISANHLLIIALALKNKSSFEIAASGIIRSNSDRNKNQNVGARTIRGKIKQVSKQSKIKFNICDLNLYAQRKIIGEMVLDI
jgi:hypothetical protein